ncbi:MAG: hypothetical protein AAF191_08825 [Verrucomicrobiota bacterium]
MKTLLFSLLSAAGLFLAGCSSPKSYDNDLSNLPHNTPQSWEGAGGLGSAFQGTR